MTVPKAVWKVLSKRDRVILVGRNVTAGVAKDGSAIAKRLPKKPPHLDTSIARAMRASRGRLLAKPAMLHVAVDSAELAELLLRGPAVRRNRSLAQIVRDLRRSDWAELLLKLKTRLGISPAKRVSAVKGLMLELDVRRLPEFQELIARSEARIAGSQGRWHKKAFVVRNARTAGDSREIADYLIVTFDDIDDPRRMWVLAVVESKSEHNAIALIHQGEFRGIPGRLDPHLGEALGQPQWVVERAKTFGLDLSEATIEGWKGRRRPGTFGPESRELVILHESDRPLGAQTTELVGVVPPDTEARTLKEIMRVTAKRKVRIWFHRMRGADATDLARDAIAGFEGAAGTSR
ncbi:MAG: hypothetical protein AB7V42_00155 [Thermoleophilia bacterium]